MPKYLNYCLPAEAVDWDIKVVPADETSSVIQTNKEIYPRVFEMDIILATIARKCI